MMSSELQTVVELSLATCYMFNQIGKGRNKYNIGKSMLLVSIVSTLNSYLFNHYKNFNNTIHIKKYVFNTENAAIFSEKIGELLFISAIFMVNHSVLSKIYGLMRIPTFLYLDSVREMFDANSVNFLTNLVFGIEFLIGAFFIVLNPILTDKHIKNGKTLVLLFMTYGFMNYLLTLFRLPFEINTKNMEIIDTITSVLNICIYLILSNSFCGRPSKQVCTFKNPEGIVDKEEAKMKSLIEFNENY
ncbi:hypothetical protein NUSPORA_01651 [Nucleospora cyclopteri]